LPLFQKVIEVHPLASYEGELIAALVRAPNFVAADVPFPDSRLGCSCFIFQVLLAPS
jgi:hypothetical protein